MRAFKRLNVYKVRLTFTKLNDRRIPTGTDNSDKFYGRNALNSVCIAVSSSIGTMNMNFHPIRTEGRLSKTLVQFGISVNKSKKLAKKDTSHSLSESDT